MKTEKNLRVAIIGGGIAGASFATALLNIGITADLYEQAPELGEVGAGIGLRPPTIAFFKKWGIYDLLEKVTTHSDYQELVDGTTSITYHKERWPAMSDNQNERYTRFVHRADLLDVLIKKIPKEHLHLNHVCTKVLDHGDYAEVHFENGIVIEADLVIGADGIRSVVRNQVFGEVTPVYSGYHAYRTLISEDDTFGLNKEENNLQIVICGSKQIYLLPLKLRRQISVDITVPHLDSSWRPNVTKETILDSIKEYDSRMIQLVNHIPMEKFTCRPLYDIDPLEKWSTGCVTLIGDAAHAMLHNIGQGANAAIQDAGVLTDYLGDLDKKSLPDILKAYEMKRKPLTTIYQNLSRIFPDRQAETALTEKEYY